MTTIDSLYELFGLSQDCTDEELRRAYHRAIRQYHPDLNPDRVEAATAKTQQLTAAYAKLMECRKRGIETLDSNTEKEQQAATKIISTSFSFASGVDLDDIARRKSSFRQSWEAFRQDPTDVLKALKLIHAAFNAERQDAIQDLLRNPILIDAASLLLFSIDSRAASQTLIRWANFLYENRLVEEGIQILEDTVSAGKATSEVVEKLRSMHYGFAQGYTSKTKKKPDPTTCIKHLNRILELGFEYGYIYKFLAEAYHELGDDTQARAYLKRAYEIDPQLFGAVRISRALGFLPEKRAKSSKAERRAKYKYTRLEHIPSANQIRKWAASGNWRDVLEFANLSNYSPRILPKSRDTLRQIAISLGDCSDPSAREALTRLLDSVYWDLREAAILSLAKIGDVETLHLLQTFSTRNSKEEFARREAIRYLEARITNQLSIVTGVPAPELIEQAMQAFATDNYGQARFLLENIAATMEEDHPSYFDVMILLSRTCAKMGDSSRAIHVIKSVLDKLPEESRYQVSKELASWLWNHLVFEAYDPANDEDYLLAIEIHLDQVLTSNDPDEVLYNLRYLTRWMEILGEGEMAQWIRSLIRIEAPGTWYVDSHDREQYVRKVELSEHLRAQLSTFNHRIKSLLPNKLSQVLQSPAALPEASHLLIDGSGTHDEDAQDDACTSKGILGSVAGRRRY